MIYNNISILRTEKGKVVEYNNDTFEQRYGFNSNRYLEYLSLLGDASDNIKGVKGIGKKTAFKIISENKSILESDNRLLLENIQIVKSNLKFLKIDCVLSINYIFNKYSKENLLMNSNEILRELNMYD